MADKGSFFDDSEAYHRSMGRVSRAAGGQFLDWLGLPDGLDWLDIGCGTGAFTELLQERTAARSISAVDPAPGQIAYARSRPGAEGIDFQEGDALALPFRDDAFDVAVMALVIQNVSDPETALSETMRVVRGGGTVAAYVWPEIGEGHPMRILSEAVASAGATERRRPEGRIRTIEALTGLFDAAGLEGIDSRVIEIRLEYAGFDDYWASQTANTVPSMSEEEVRRLEAALRERLPTDGSGRIALAARANAIRGRVPV